MEITAKIQQQRAARRRLHPIPNKLIKDIRVYYPNLPTKALYPYDYQYSHIFKKVLAAKAFHCPVYDHLYIQVAPTLEEAFQQAIVTENWYTCGIAQIDFETYQQATASQKEKLVLEVLIRGLEDIVELDKLDKTIFKETIAHIQKHGLETELLHKVIEHKDFQLVVSYFSRSMEEQCPIFFTLIDKKTLFSKKIQIGTAQQEQIPLWLQKIKLTKKAIKVYASSSVKADVWLDKLPRKMEFKLSEILSN